MASRARRGASADRRCSAAAARAIRLRSGRPSRRRRSRRSGPRDRRRDARRPVVPPVPAQTSALQSSDARSTEGRRCPRVPRHARGRARSPEPSSVSRIAARARRSRSQPGRSPARRPEPHRVSRGTTADAGSESHAERLRGGRRAPRQRSRPQQARATPRDARRRLASAADSCDRCSSSPR